MRKSTAKWTIGKGLLTAIGGGLLAASVATPVGWLLLGVGAVLGGIAVYRKYKDKQQRKKEVAMRELGVTEQDRQAWKRRVEAIKKRTWWGTTKRKQELAQEPDPLQSKLDQLHFKSVSHFYANYINYTANKIYQEGVGGRAQLENQITVTAEAKGARLRDALKFPELRKLRESLRRLSSMSYEEIRAHFRISADEGNPYPDIEKLLAGMGLKFDFQKAPPEPSAEKVGKALHE
jgi:hypothetical protein